MGPGAAATTAGSTGSPASASPRRGRPRSATGDGTFDEGLEGIGGRQRVEVSLHPPVHVRAALRRSAALVDPSGLVHVPLHVGVGAPVSPQRTTPAKGPRVAALIGAPRELGRRAGVVSPAPGSPRPLLRWRLMLPLCLLTNGSVWVATGGPIDADQQRSTRLPFSAAACLLVCASKAHADQATPRKLFRDAAGRPPRAPFVDRSRGYTIHGRMPRWTSRGVDHAPRSRLQSACRPARAGGATVRDRVILEGHRRDDLDTSGRVAASARSARTAHETQVITAKKRLQLGRLAERDPTRCAAAATELSGVG